MADDVPAVPICARCGAACPSCAAAALPDGYAVIQLTEPDRVVVVDAPRHDPDRLARQVVSADPRRARRIDGTVPARPRTRRL